MENNQTRTVREQLQYALLWLLFIWVSCLCAILVDALFLKIVTSIVKTTFVTEAILHVIATAIGTAAPLAAISYLIAYHLGEFSGLYSALEGVLALAFLLPFGILLGFPSWITGGVRWLAGLMEYGTHFYDTDQLSDMSLLTYLLAFLIFGIFYLVVKYCFGVLGRNRRIKARIELTGSPIKPTERDNNDFAV